MKKKRRLFSFILAVLFTLALAPASYGAESYEVSHGDMAVALWENGLFLGSDGSFDLDKPLLRSEAAVMVVRLLGKEAEAKSGDYSHPFDDVPDWASPYVGYCYENGILKGASDTKYGSATAITAAQFTTLVLRVLGYKDPYDFTPATAVQKARDIYYLNIDEAIYERSYSPTGTFLRDHAVYLSYVALNEWLKGTDTSLKETIEMPGRPAGEVPTYTASGTNPPASPSRSSGSSSGSSGGPSGTVPTGKVTAEYEYATNGVLDTVTYYRDGKEVASFYDGGQKSGVGYVRGGSWTLAVNLRAVSKYLPPPLPNYPGGFLTDTIKTPASITISSSGEIYTILNSDSWKDDAFIVKNNLEPVINFIINEFENQARILMNSGYR